MYNYAKYCPVAAATALIGDFWTPLIVRELLYGTEHFNQLARNVPGISRSLLASRLRSLEKAGALVREQASASNSVRYVLTEAGRDLRSIIEALGAWGTRWAVADSDATNLDPYTVVCMLKSSIRVAALPESRVVIEATITGTPDTRAWLVCERQQVSMCVDPPGFDVDLCVSTNAITIYQIWRQDLHLKDAIRQRRVQIEGPAALVHALPGWFEVPAAAKAG